MNQMARSPNQLGILHVCYLTGLMLSFITLTVTDTVELGLCPFPALTDAWQNMIASTCIRGPASQYKDRREDVWFQI